MRAAVDSRPLRAAIDPAAARSWGDTYRDTGAGGVGGTIMRALVFGVHSAAQRDRESQHWYRLASFAVANGLEYVPRYPASGLPGIIFTAGADAAARDVFRTRSGRFIEIGDYSYSTAEGQRLEDRRTWGYVGIRLDAPLPHIVLDGRANNVLGSNLPRAFSGGQRVRLEGDFDRYFTLSAPTGYETDALYLFTPDVMTRFIDRVSGLDTEIVDDWLFLYIDGGLDLASPAVWEWLADTLAVLLDRVDRWGRWRDARTPLASAVAGVESVPGPGAAALSNPGVAAEGRRLRRTLPLGAVLALIAVPVAVIAFGALAVWSVLGPLLAR